MTDQDLLYDRPNPEFGSGVIGVCDICGRRQAVIVLQKERFKLCVLDFLNKSWLNSPRTPGAPLPLYRSERIWFPTRTLATGRAPAIMLSPTKQVKHPTLLITPEVYGLTTTLLDAAVHFARDGFEVMLPDVANTPLVGPSMHLSMRMGRRTKGGISASSRGVATLLEYYRDALRALRLREMVDPEKTAVFGVSYGASLAALLAAAEPKLAAVALAYPVPIHPADELRRITAPTQVLYGDKDASAAAFTAAWGKLGDLSRPPEVVVLSGAGHGFLGRDLPGYAVPIAEEGWGRCSAFLRVHLLPAPPKPPPAPAAKPPAPAAPPSAAVTLPSAAAPAPVSVTAPPTP